MYNPNDVFPHPNLSDSSAPWARKVTDAVRNLGYEVTRHGLVISGNNRAQSAQLGLVSRQLEQINTQQLELNNQVTELQSRSTHSVVAENLQIISGAGFGEWGPVSRSFNFPPPQGGRRTATLLGTGIMVWTGATTSFPQIGSGVSVGVQVRQGASPIWNSSGSVGSNSMFTFSNDTQGSLTFAVPVNVPAAGSSFDLRMWVGSTSANADANSGCRIENLTFTILYGDKY